MMDQEYFQNKLNLLARNFSKSWATEERKRILWDLCEELKITAKVFDKTISFFIRTDERPSIEKMHHKMKVIQESESRVIQEEHLCSQCNNEFTIWVQHPRKKQALLMMGCHLCKDENPDYNIPDGIPVYNTQFTIMENQLIKAVQKIDKTKLGLGNGQFIKLVERVNYYRDESRRYFKAYHKVGRILKTREKAVSVRNTADQIQNHAPV